MLFEWGEKRDVGDPPPGGGKWELPLEKTKETEHWGGENILGREKIKPWHAR